MHPVLIKGKKGFADWAKKPYKKGDGHIDSSNMVETVRVKKFVGGPAGFQLHDNQQVAMDTTDNFEMNLPIHRPCLELAKLFCTYQRRFDINFRDSFRKASGGASNLAHLYEIWVKRAWMATPGHMGVIRCLVPEDSRYGGIFLHPDLQQYLIARKLNDGFLSEIHPISPAPDAGLVGDPPQTTLAVMKNLKIMKDDERSPPEEFYIDLQSCLDGTPRDIVVLILQAMEPFNDLRPRHEKPTRVLPLTWWKDQLFNGDLFPWLFDLSENHAKDIVRQACEKDGVNFDSLDWEIDFDWEGLCRQLGQAYVFEPRRGILAGASNLENRHRIWGLFESARNGHFLTHAGKDLHYRH